MRQRAEQIIELKHITFLDWRELWREWYGSIGGRDRDEPSNFVSLTRLISTITGNIKYLKTFQGYHPFRGLSGQFTHASCENGVAALNHLMDIGIN